MSGPPGRRPLEELGDLLTHPTGFRPPVLSLVRENLSVLKVAGRLLPHQRAETTPDPDRVPVLLVPGFLSGDFALEPMAEALRGLGHWTSRSGIAPNIGCTRELADAVESRLEQVAERTGRRVAIVGWSRGGTLGKIATIRRPDLVAALVTLGTPNTDPLAVNSTLAAQLTVIRRLSALGVPGLLGDDCLSGDCALEVKGWLEQDVPDAIPYTSLFSLDDAVIDWRACLDPDAEPLEVHATHMSMGADPEVIDVVGELLGGLVPTALAA
ncbi:MAG: alpha/beta hydrolase [Frankiales bacterium]|nr:alpha/beta hydrolase [Frankiales bacterium]